MRSYCRAADAVCVCHYHFVFITKYRKPVLKGEIALAVRDITRQCEKGVEQRRVRASRSSNEAPIRSTRAFRTSMPGYAR